MMVVAYLLLHIPFYINKRQKKVEQKWVMKLSKILKILIIVFGALHGIYYWLIEGALTSKLLSGVMIYILMYVFMISGNHSGIEDKVARNVFKILSWVIILLVLILHLM